MPGFFLTFILLCFAGGWSRYLADRSGREWPMIIPGVGLGLWTLFTLVGVFTAATVGGTSGDVEADGMKLARVLAAVLGTAPGMLPTA